MVAWKSLVVVILSDDRGARRPSICTGGNRGAPGSSAAQKSLHKQVVEAVVFDKLGQRACAAKCDLPDPRAQHKASGQKKTQALLRLLFRLTEHPCPKTVQEDESGHDAPVPQKF